MKKHFGLRFPVGSELLNTLLSVGSSDQFQPNVAAERMNRLMLSGFICLLSGCACTAWALHNILR